MPPPLSESENESSDNEAKKTITVESSAKKRGRLKKTPSVSEEEKEVLAVEKDENEEEEEGEENEEDVYVVESIKTHMFDDQGNILFHVKWEGYDKPSDMTWEPEANLGTAGEIVEEYYNSIGGRQFVHDEARAATKQPKKRGRAATAAAPAVKRGKKEHPKDSTPPASLKEKAFKPPSGSWEDEVKAVDACEGTDGEVQVYLTWNNGRKTCHPKEMVYKRCPQRMLKFYESHLSFSPEPKKSERKTNKSTESSRKEAAPARRGRPKKRSTDE